MRQARRWNVRKVTLAILTLAVFPAGLAGQGPPAGRGPGKIKVSPDVVYFTKTGNETQLVRTVRIHRTGPPSGTLSVTTQVTGVSGGNWLSVSPLAGDTLTLTATPGSLGAGAYQATVTVTVTGQGGSTHTIQAFLRILSGPAGAPAAFVRPASLSFRMIQNGANPEPKTLAVSSPTGGASFSWTAGRTIATPGGGNWFQIALTNTTGPGLITVTVNGAGLAVGQYTGSITVTSGGSSTPVSVTLEVQAPGGSSQGQSSGKLVVVPQALNFIVHPGSPAPGPKTLNVKTSGNAVLNWTAVATSAEGWLSIPVSAQSGTTPSTIPVSVNPAGLARGHYQGSVKVTAGGRTETVRVFLRIVGPPGGSGPATAGGVSASAVQIAPRAIEFSSTGGVVTPAAVPLQIASSTPGLTFSATRSTARGGNWLNLSSPTSGPLPATLQVTATPGNLEPGLYTGLITVAIAGAVSEQRLLPVTLRVAAPGATARLAVNPGGIAFQAARGGANPAGKQVAVEARGASSIAYQTTVSTVTGSNWLAVSPAAGTAPANVTVSVNIANLAAGVYHGFVVFQATGSPGAIPATLQVQLTVGSGGGNSGVSGLQVLFLEPGPEFVAAANSPTAVRALVVNSDGNPIEGAEVQITPSGAEPAFRLEALGGGVYSGVFRSLAGGPVSLTALAQAGGATSVVFGVGGDLESGSEAIPVIFQEGIVNGASFAPGATPVAPGSLLSVFGVNLTEITALAASLPLPRELAGVKILVGGLEAPLVAAVAEAGPGYDQILFQLPAELGTATYADVVVVNNGVISGAEGLSLAPAVPAAFTISQQGTGAAAALHGDFAPVSATRPARPGQTILLFATGLGAVRPPVTSGEPPAALSAVTGSVALTIGGRPATLSFAGLAPGFVGLYQVNVIVPQGLLAGEAELLVSVDGISSGEGVTIPIG